ncbi:LLM class flavin-dependent oxidoreductase [Kineococcus gynurae]|uniref:LLM class flavin-dependent oxidoreductase n=1 Tax=Kineococcus gynurae TaxID=452979 RepID=A0ABV5LQS7_9ACTN
MPAPGTPLRRLGFLTMGTFDPADPGPGHAFTLDLMVLGEELGLDSVWLRHRHLQPGISSPTAILAAATQRTSRIELGTAVTPLGWENPLRLAEDLGTVDVLSGGRLNPGFSTGRPMNFEAYRDALYPGTADAEEFGYERMERLLRALAGEQVSTLTGTRGVEVFSPRVEPHAPGLLRRTWFGAGSTRSAVWAGEHGLNLLSSSIVKAEPLEPGGPEVTDFATVQAAQVGAFRAAHPAGAAARASQGLVVVPTDSATAAQRSAYAAYAEARLPRTRAPQGPARMMFAPDLVGPAERIAEELYAHAGFRAVDEVVFALPFAFQPEDYRQILTDLATRLGPLLGWEPREPRETQT